MQVQQEMASAGLRVLALASGVSLPGSDAVVRPGEGLTFAGLIGLHDAPREGVAESVSQLRHSGVAVTMITGDSVETAMAIATKLCIVDSMAMEVDGGAVAMSGHTVDQLTEVRTGMGLRVFCPCRVQSCELSCGYTDIHHSNTLTAHVCRRAALAVNGLLWVGLCLYCCCRCADRRSWRRRLAPSVCSTVPRHDTR